MKCMRKERRRGKRKCIDSNIGDPEARIIREALRDNTTLTKLDLNGVEREMDEWKGKQKNVL